MADWLTEWTDGWMNGRMDGWIETRHTSVSYHSRFITGQVTFNYWTHTTKLSWKSSFRWISKVLLLLLQDAKGVSVGVRLVLVRITYWTEWMTACQPASQPTCLPGNLLASFLLIQSSHNCSLKHTRYRPIAPIIIIIIIIITNEHFIRAVKNYSSSRSSRKVTSFSQRWLRQLCKLLSWQYS